MINSNYLAEKYIGEILEEIAQAYSKKDGQACM